MPKILVQHAIVNSSVVPPKKATVQSPNLESIVKKLESSARGGGLTALEISNEEISFCKTVNIPDRITRRKIIDLIFSEKLKDEPVSETLASNENIISGDDEAREIFIRITTEPPSRYSTRRVDRLMASSDDGDSDDNGLFLGEDDSTLSVSSVKRGFCLNKNLIPKEKSERGSQSRGRITDYIMKNYSNPIATLLAKNENLYLCEEMEVLKLWAKELPLTTTAVNIIENLRLQRIKTKQEDKNSTKPSTPLKQQDPQEAAKKEGIKRIIDRIKHNPKTSELTSKDRLILMSYSEDLVAMQGEDEKFVFDLMQNPSLVNNGNWATVVNKTIFHFEDNSEHSFVLGVALNEQKNKIEKFRIGLLEIAIKYPFTLFTKNLLCGLTEFTGKDDLRLVSVLPKYNPELQTILKKNKSYQAAFK